MTDTGNPGKGYVELTVSLEKVDQLEKAATEILDFVKHCRQSPAGESAKAAEPVEDCTSIRNQFEAMLFDELAHFECAVAAGEWDEVVRRSNQLAGDAGLYGLHEVSQLARKLEEHGRRKDPEEALQVVRELAGGLRKELGGDGPGSESSM